MPESPGADGSEECLVFSLHAPRHLCLKFALAMKRTAEMLRLFGSYSKSRFAKEFLRNSPTRRHFLHLQYYSIYYSKTDNLVMERPYSETNNLSIGEEIERFTYGMELILLQLNLTHTFISYLFKADFIIMLPSMLRSAK